MHDDIEPPHADAPYRVEARFGTVDRSPILATALVAALVGLAILKPWVVDGPSPSGSAGADDRAAAATNQPIGVRRPTPAPTSTGEAVIGLCHDPGSWRTATIETWRDQTVRVWRAIDPGPASGPLDATIPVVPAVGSAIPAIGYCAPTSGPEQPRGAASIRAWLIEGEDARVLPLTQIAPIRDVSPYGALFGPPAALGSTGTWPNGLIVFRYEELASKAERWFAIEISGTSDRASPRPSQPPAGR